MTNSYRASAAEAEVGTAYNWQKEIEFQKTDYNAVSSSGDFKALLDAPVRRYLEEQERTNIPEIPVSGLEELVHKALSQATVEDIEKLPPDLSKRKP